MYFKEYFSEVENKFFGKGEKREVTSSGVEKVREDRNERLKSQFSDLLDGEIF